MSHSLVFIHRLVSGSIIVVILAINSPAHIFTAFSFVILFLCTFVLQVLLMNPSPNTTKLKKFLLVVFHSIVFVAYFMSLVSICTMYLMLLKHALHYSTLGGFVLSAIPLVIVIVVLLALGYYIKKLYYANLETRNATLPEQAEEGGRNDAQPRQPEQPAVAIPEQSVQVQAENRNYNNCGNIQSGSETQPLLQNIRIINNY